MADVDFCNAGAAALLRVPGFGYPVNIERKPDERFAHGAIDWAQPRLTAREIAMLHLMKSITAWSRASCSTARARGAGGS